MTGIILINFGGPRTTEEIEPFLQDILKDVLPRPLKPFAKIFARLRLPRAKKMYDAIGGTSPVVDWTTKQAQALEHKLNTLAPSPLPSPSRGEGEGGGDTRYKAYIAMKYGKPSIEEAVTSAKKDGCEKISLLPLFPYQSKYTIPCHPREGGDLVHLNALDSRLRGNDKAVIDIIKSSLAELRNIPPPQVTFLFTVHSIPSCSAKNEPYVRQINESVSKIMERFTGYNYQLAYQSAPFRFGWLGPDVKSAIRQIKTHELLIVPLGFACENLETLYEIDQLYLPYAKDLGLNVKRTPALNDNPIFIDLLAEMVLGSVHGEPVEP